MSIIFFNIGWMCKYQGEADGDRVESNFGHVQKTGTGDERFNFMPLNGYLYGYVPIPGEGDEPNAIHIEKLDGTKDADSLSHITVVFFSLRPQNKVAYIVGWYKDATIYRYPQSLPGRRIDGRQFYYSVRTRIKNGVCIPVSQRTFMVPSAARMGKGYYGQYCIWYAEDKPKFKQKVEEYISSYKPESHKVAKIKAFHNNNLKNKLLVEKNAVATVTEYYTNLGFTVESVEKDNVGWDLEAVHLDGTEYHIEVKGLAGNEISAQLTPNEYAALKREYKKYILAICTDCLNDPLIHIFNIMKRRGKIYARDDDGNLLDFIESVAANAKIRE